MTDAAHLSGKALSGGPKVASWIAQVAAAAILGQTLFFKFSGAEEAVYIFETLGVEPWGRIATAVFELVAVVLLLWPSKAIFGASLSLGLMVGALGAHLGPLGIEVMDDGGTLFAMGVVVLVASSTVLVLRRREALALIARFTKPGEPAT
ncbi:MAG: DoxX family protein [Planctomycetota bacterium]